MSAREHKERAKNSSSAKCAVITISDTRTQATDVSGKIAIRILEKAKHNVQFYKVLKNDTQNLLTIIRKLAGKVDLIITIGGTGISKKDISVEVVKKLAQKTLDGFGELFRNLSYEEIGTASIMTRAALGVRDKTILLALPGSTNAVKLAIDKILLPELKHILWELKRY